MQGDGNFVVYRLADGHAMWSTNTSGSGASVAVMQTDGNFVLYTADNRVVWNTGTWQSGPQPNQFTVDDDGTAVIVTYAPVWSTGTSSAGNPAGPALEFKFGDSFTRGQLYNAANGYQWTFQTDGNLVLYRNGAPIWNAGSNGAQYARFDGNLVAYKDTGYSYLSPVTQPPAGMVYQDGSLTLNADSSHFVIQADGNAVIYKAFRIWGSTPGTPAPAGTFAVMNIYKTWGGASTANEATSNAIASANLECQTYYKRGTPIGIPLTSVEFDSHFHTYNAWAMSRCQYLK